MDYLEIYNKVRSVPANAQKEIKGGRLNGFTDINPMWRIKILTETFGPCGLGWWFEIKDKRIEFDSETKSAAAFVDILLFFTWNGETSHGIPGSGGSLFVTQERNGPRMSDECYKMALTDAIGNAAKNLGVGADIYWDRDCTKYGEPVAQAEQKKIGKPKGATQKSAAQKSAEPPTEHPKQAQLPTVCADCGGEITGYKIGGTEFSLADHLRACKRTFGVAVCRACADRRLNATSEISA